jgi:hypothetical protein
MEATRKRQLSFVLWGAALAAAVSALFLLGQPVFWLLIVGASS